jgi:hypothetical protein
MPILNANTDINQQNLVTKELTWSKNSSILNTTIYGSHPKNSFPDRLFSYCTECLSLLPAVSSKFTS